MKQLDPKAFWLFFLDGILRSIFLILLLSSWILIEVFDQVNNIEATSILISSLLAIIVVLGILVIYAKLTYRYYKYELTENGFRKEYGIIWKKYVTIPYERIQNVDIYRGVIARLLGLSDLNIQTAGMSGGTGAYGGGSEGRLPALSMQEAELIRDELISRARQSKTQGL